MNRNINLNVEKPNNSSSHYRINLIVAKLCKFMEEKEAISHVDSEKVLNRLDKTDLSNIHQFIQYREGTIPLIPDDANSLQMEIISEVAEILLEQEFGIPSNDMFDDDGQFYEQYQDRFNDLYDDLEEELINLDFKTL
ncbi:MAG: hypothetical protein VB074_08970 [Proteiniphilum sp.]|uniref:hypothetical protein n=1 Tax=Proteiniphilum sp. TaxID=1926877 RepID=UPI002B20A773|nr:hypothetical protein [Proteiniphilum sp.]MEA5128302.1 hypothetical protein [Proteiniphilum sp.]